MSRQPYCDVNQARFAGYDSLAHNPIRPVPQPGYVALLTTQGGT